MDPGSLAIAAVSLIATFLGRVGDQAASQAAEGLGQAVVGRLSRLYEAVRRRVAPDSFARVALERLEDQPENERRQGALEDALAEIAAADRAFREELAGLLEEVQAAGGDRIQISESGVVAIHGAVKMRGRYVSGRDMSFGTGPPPEPDLWPPPEPDR